MALKSKAASKSSPPVRSAPPPPRHFPGVRVLIIEARFYENISDELVAGAIAALDLHGVKHNRINVPGALEIPQVLAQVVTAGLVPRQASNARWDGVVALGCVIRGETSHYDIVCNNANHWLMEVAMRNGVPLGNGILTVDNEAQALARARGGAEGKGGDAARACLRLIELARAFQGQSV
jgi:6,7-dimethyl-8-ribityllumazine synthase